VKVVIDGVNLQVGPLDTNSMDKEEIKKRKMASKMEQLRVADQFINFTGETMDIEKDKKNKGTASLQVTQATYVQQMTAKIIDNIEITLKNVHIRYEDSSTIPGIPFSAGITLNAFSLATCDEKWHEKFLKRDLNKSGESIRKLAKVSNFGFYWMTKSRALKGESFRDWSDTMRSLIYPGVIDAMTYFDDIQYILHPANTLILKLIHNEENNENLPKFDITVESSNFPISIDRAQYLQYLCASAMISSLQKRKQPRSYCPYERPTSSIWAKAWWKYALKLVVKGKRYIQLVKQSKMVLIDNEKNNDLSVEDKREMLELEERLPLRSLVIFRQKAAKEIQLEATARHYRLRGQALAKGLQMKEPSEIQHKPVENRTWMEWAYSAKTDEKIQKKTDKKGDVVEDEGDVSIESIIASMEKQVGAQAIDIDKGVNKKIPLYKLSLATSASVDISVGGQPVATATMALEVSGEVNSWGQYATIHMRDLLVIDRCTISPAIQNIISVKKLSSPDSGSSTNIWTNVQEQVFVDRSYDHLYCQYSYYFFV
jgi:vacuolar protein sorting-associated protein 13A/C